MTDFRKGVGFLAPSSLISPKKPILNRITVKQFVDLVFVFTLLDLSDESHMISRSDNSDNRFTLRA